MDSHEPAHTDAAFERALSALLAGEPLDDALAASPVAPAAPAALEALRVLSAIGQTSRTALFGEARAAADLTRWGHLEIREEIGRGASGTVYRAWDSHLAREVALKLFDPDSASTDAALVEGRLLAQVRHPHVVTVYGADTFDGVPGLWMELVQGDSLDALVERDGPMGAEETLLAGLDLAGALAAVHAAGLLHRDLKARNVVRQRGGRLVLMDFGAGHELAGSLTAGGAVGTPLYMAPELLAGGPASVQADIYGLGVLLYHLLTASYPVTAEGFAALVAAHAAGAHRPLADQVPDLPAVASAAVTRACAPDPAARYASARELESALAAALNAVLSVEPRLVPGPVRWWRRWRRRLAAVAALVGAIAITVWLGWNTAPGRAARRLAGLPVPPRSPLYLTFDGGLAVLEGTDLRLLPGGGPGGHAIAVTERLGVRTRASGPPFVGGAWLDPAGRPERAAPATEDLCCLPDGTTDGRYNYALRQDSTLLEPIGSRPLAPPAIFRFGPDWRDGQLLFTLAAPAADVTGSVYHGIAFDGATQTFWVTRYASDGTAQAEQWGPDGRLRATVPLRPFSFGVAVDPADGTLWVFRDDTAGDEVHLDNIAPTGQFLGTVALRRLGVTGVRAMLFSGLEFAWPHRQ